MQHARSRRRSLRRAVAVSCTVQSSYWDGTVALPASDLSDEGVWIDTALPLDPGAELVLSFRAPGYPCAEVWALAEVARVGLWRRTYDPWPPGMGLLFTYVSASDRALLSHALRGRPPRLPVALPRSSRPPPLPPRHSEEAVDPRCLPPVLAVAYEVEPAVDAALTFTAVSCLLTSERPARAAVRAG